MSSGNHKIVIRDASYYRRVREFKAERSNKNLAERAEALRMINREMISAGVNQPPVNLSSFSKYLGVRSIYSTTLPMRGRLLREGNELTIEVNKKLDECERQRTIAHELAHVVLERERIGAALATGKNKSRSIPHTQIEKLCDLCGDEILLPQEWLRKQLSKSGRRLSTIVEITAQTKLSIDFVLSRIVELSLIPSQVIWCVNKNGKFKIQKWLPHDLDQTYLVWIDIINTPASPLLNAWKTSGPVSGELAFRIENKKELFPVECMKTNTGSVVCILNRIVR